MRIQILLKLLIGHLIPRLIPPIKRSIFLHSIVSQMNFPIKIMNIKLIRWSTDVSLFIPIGFEYAMKLTYQEIVADIKFTSFVEKRPVYIELHYKCFLGTIVMLFLGFHYCVQFVNLVDYCYAVTAVSQFSRLDYPNITQRMLHCLSTVHFSLLLFDMVLSFFVISYKSFVLRVFTPLLNMESQRNTSKKIAPCQLIVLLEIIKQCLFVTQVKISSQMVVHPLIYCRHPLLA